MIVSSTKTPFVADVITIKADNRCHSRLGQDIKLGAFGVNRWYQQKSAITSIGKGKTPHDSCNNIARSRSEVSNSMGSLQVGPIVFWIFGCCSSALAKKVLTGSINCI